LLLEKKLAGRLYKREEIIYSSIERYKETFYMTAMTIPEVIKKVKRCIFFG